MVLGFWSWDESRQGAASMLVRVVGQKVDVGCQP